MKLKLARLAAIAGLQACGQFGDHFTGLHHRRQTQRLGLAAQRMGLRAQPSQLVAQRVLAARGHPQRGADRGA